jgi:hypothetical protein
MIDLEDEFPGFRYQVLIGEASISEAESQVAEGTSAEHDDDSYSERHAWQRERETLRNARARGMSFSEYEDRLREEELEEKLPSETEFEDVAVIVYFPNMRARNEEDSPDSTFMLKAKVSTMAIQGLTPAQAEIVNQARSGGATASGDPTGGASSGAGDR